ncbi:MAG: thioredoxin domain-containing protein [Trueperaceae bacterium]|jgi:protein-disulfide isomerase|nr:thioredoxin domain-containing protein [Truepera sp.]HRN19125.1 thioredoxin domain-containing protein [Trueperaceae bacterium]HRQ10853.1 thioredoxin domain-containing protein [Trueperaceae bacterium]
MNSQRLTLLTIIIAVLVVLAAVIVPRLTSSKQPAAVATIDYSAQPRLGDPDAPVKIAVFLDFLCPHCADFSENEAPTIVREFVDTGKASLYYLNFPVIDPAVRSRYLAVLGECVYQQSNDAFFKLEPIWMRAQSQVARDTSRALDLAVEYAPELDAAQLRTCVSTSATADAVRTDEAIAREANVTGTPSVLIDGVLLANPSLANIRSAVEAASR